MTMESRWRRCVLGLAALAAVHAAPGLAAEDDRRPPAAPAPAIGDSLVIEIPPQAGVIIDRDPAAADVEGRMLACYGMPGCRAFWQKGAGIIMILGFDFQPPQPP
jgi:hypothetical protein